jgi:hypothetical protein
VTRFALTAVVAVALLAMASPAFAIFPQLSTPLAGTPINGVTPSGGARVDQSKLPQTPGTLSVEVKNVNLPDGTALIIELDGSAVGTINLVRGQGKVSTTIPMQVGRGAIIKIGVNGVVVLTNPAAWNGLLPSGWSIWYESHSRP